MSVLRSNVYANPETPIWVNNTDGGPPLITTFTGPFSGGTGLPYQGYAYSQTYNNGSNTKLSAIMSNFVFQPNTTYLVNIAIQIDQAEVDTQGSFNVFYGDPDGEDYEQIGKSFFYMTSSAGSVFPGCNISFTFANGDPAEFKGIFFFLYPGFTSGSGDTKLLDGDHQTTLWTSTFAIAEKGDSRTDNGLSFWTA